MCLTTYLIKTNANLMLADDEDAGPGLNARVLLSSYSNDEVEQREGFRA